MRDWNHMRHITHLYPIWLARAFTVEPGGQQTAATKMQSNSSWHEFLDGPCKTIFSKKVMMTSSNGNIFLATGPLWGKPPVTGGFPLQWPVTQSFCVSFDLRLNKRLSKQSSAGDLRRHRVHYDVTVMDVCWNPCDSDWQQRHCIGREHSPLGPL